MAFEKITRTKEIQQQKVPFTFSHPAIILPLTFLPRRWFSLTGLVIGSLAPDFEYFLRMRIQSDYSHTVAGLFWFDLPLGLLLAFVFHNIVRNSLLVNLPPFLQSRFSDFQKFDWNDNFAKHWLVISISTLIGATSHIFWDSFTHDHGYFVKPLPVLTNTVNILGGEVPILKILQHGSSLLGAFVIAFAMYKMPTQKHDTTSLSLKYWLFVAGITLVIIAIRLATDLELKQYGT